ncbi:hypothetical protein BVY02_02115, partial [bacterium J17]
ELGSSGVIVAALVIVVICLFLVPLPPAILDLLLVTNILVALTLLLKGLFISQPMGLFSFPTILLLTTLFRLALNVSSTRLILLNGDTGVAAAGRVISSFGQFVVQGNFVVGAIIFAVIAIVNFVVIAKGSARVAEVSARFTLDALPGKQLAVDADLRTGNITRDEASERREDLTRESQFFGAMDGAMKFVQGDAIAGLAITFINAVGGIAIGKSRGLSFEEAVNTFGVLTIGDGLVSIIPSLLVSVCAGVVVTHVGSPSNRGSGGEIFVQLLSQPKAIAISAVALLALSLLPGFPFLPFLLVCGGLLLSLVVAKSQANHASIAETIPSLFKDDEDSGVPLDSRSDIKASPVQVLRLEVDSSALGAFLLAGDRSVDDDFNKERSEVYAQRGLLLPELELNLSETFAPGEYRVFLRERLVRQGRISRSERLAVCNTSLAQTINISIGELARHPVSSRPAFWVDKNLHGLRALKKLGVELLTPNEFLVLEVVGAALEDVDSVLGVNEVKTMLESMKLSCSFLLDEVFSTEMISYSEFTDVLRRLAKEHVSIRDLKQI